MSSVITRRTPTWFYVIISTSSQMTHLENAHHSCKHPLPNGLNIFSTYFIIKMLYDIYDIENVLINCVTGKASGQ